MKKTTSTILCIVMALSLLAGVAGAAGGLENFKKTNTYKQGQFTDVSTDAWYAKNVAAAYEYALMDGQSASSFGTNANVKLAEAIAMAARLHSIYSTGTASFAQSSPWYQSYVDYAVKNGIIGANRFENYEANATRFQFAEIFAAALPSTALPAINQIADGQIPDVSLETPYEHVYKLYRAGVLTGKTEYGHFKPADNILRSECATIVVRMADQSLREKFTIKKDESGGGDVTEIANATQLIEALGSARQSAALALEAAAEAKGYYDSVTGATAGDLAMLALGNAAKQSADKLVLMAAQYASLCENFCKANAAYAVITEDLELAKNGMLQASQMLSALTHTSSNELWKKTTDTIEGAGGVISIAQAAAAIIAA